MHAAYVSLGLLLHTGMRIVKFVSRSLPIKQIRKFF